ncbi:translation protein [Suhomyces tanzawaensis NRRL Y-17324]|uniref:Large ribosomal subunit protein uL3m n=1 Tax=Suhomyces tanzawaensis NRRL Y-17324 TaxID=984487 RepID=A0A1E4SF70_9ASCO|nr:translation protein [Suhomyces tanzawaensis NRRL Y-17324]ODV78164.1 translation protein [Suhomyces tanzawaensis NRRL Y-17324]
MIGRIWSTVPKTASVRPLVFSRGVAQIISIHAVPSVKTNVPTLKHSLEESNLRKNLLSRPGLLGIKRGMITWFTEQGEQYAATVIEIDACEVINHKTIETDGYNSVVLGQIDKLKNISEKNLKQFQIAGVSPKQNIGEFRIRDQTGLIPIGTELKADYFAVGQLVDIKGVTKGKGFAGVMKRHGFAGLNASHGVSKAHRSAGGMGGNQDPGRVLPGKKMAGRMGGNNCTVLNSQVLHADPEAGILVIKGQIPGPNKSFVKIMDSRKLYGKSLNKIRQEEGV